MPDTPAGAEQCRCMPLVVCYSVDQLPAYDTDFYDQQGSPGYVLLHPGYGACFTPDAL